MHVPADLLHLIKGRSDQSAYRDDISIESFRLVEDGFLICHHSEIMNFESVAAQHGTCNILAYVMNITLYCCYYHFRALAFFFVIVHIRFKNGNSISHDFCRLHYLRKEHPAFTEHSADRFHSRHQRTFDYCQGATILFQRLLQVRFHGCG